MIDMGGPDSSSQRAQSRSPRCTACVVLTVTLTLLLCGCSVRTTVLGTRTESPLLSDAPAVAPTAFVPLMAPPMPGGPLEPDTSPPAPDASAPAPSCPDQSSVDAAQPDCVCTKAGLSCPMPAACVAIGTYLRSDFSLEVQLAENGTMFASDTLGATLDTVRSEAYPGFYGTWTLSADVLVLQTVHLPTEPSCDGSLGRYRVMFTADCMHLTLIALDDACAERNALAAAPLDRDTRGPVAE